jgi:hypothetical protein
MHRNVQRTINWQLFESQHSANRRLEIHQQQPSVRLRVHHRTTRVWGGHAAKGRMESERVSE